MARKCPDCGRTNSDEQIFCVECGEPIDPKTRLMMELEGKKAPTNYSGIKKSSAHKEDDDDDDYTPMSSYDDEEEKKSPLGRILLLVAAAALIYFFFLR